MAKLLPTVIKHWRRIRKVRYIGNCSEALTFNQEISGCEYNGKLFEMIIIEDVLTDRQVAEINYYLSKKWGLETTVDSDGDGYSDELEEILGTSPIDATDIPGVDFSNSVDAQIGEASGFDSIESNLALWLDATNIDLQSNATLSDGEDVLTWLDLSGNGNNFPQSSTGSQPTLNDDNIVFDGSDDYLEVASFIETNDNITKFIVLDVESGGNYFCKTDGDSSWESGENIWWLGDGDTSGPGIIKFCWTW